MLKQDSMRTVTDAFDALHESFMPKPEDERAPFMNTEPALMHAQEALKAFGLLCIVCGDDGAISDLLIAHWPAANAWIDYLDPVKGNIRSCPTTLYARPADAVALALSGYVQLLHNKGILNKDRVSFKTLVRFWTAFPRHFPAPAAVGEDPTEADILFRGRDAAVTDLLLRVLTASDPAAREAAAHAILAEGSGSARGLMRAAASRLIYSQRFAFIPRDRYVHTFPRLADHIVLRYRYAEVCAAIAALPLSALRKSLHSRNTARDLVHGFHFFAMVSFDRSAALKVCAALAALCAKSADACVFALRGGMLIALHRFLTPRAGDIIQLRLRKGADDLAPIRALTEAVSAAMMVRSVLVAFGEACVKQGILKMDNPPSCIWRRLMLRFARCQLDLEAFDRARLCQTCAEKKGKVCCADTYYCSVVCQTADRGRHRHVCSAVPTRALPPLASSMPISMKDPKFAVFAANQEVKRSGTVRRMISAFIERPAVSKCGRDVHARVDYRKGKPTVTLCLSTGVMRQADPPEDAPKSTASSDSASVLLNCGPTSARASPRVIVDVVFTVDQSTVIVPVGMYRFTIFDDQKREQKTVRLTTQPRFAPQTPMFVFGACHPPERKRRPTLRGRAAHLNNERSWPPGHLPGLRHAFAAAPAIVRACN